MEMDLDFINMIGYNNSKIKIENDTTVCYLSGSCLTIWDLLNNERKYIWSK